MMKATWQVNDDENGLITLTVSSNEPPAVDLHHGSGQHSFNRTDIEPGENYKTFRAWLDQAVYEQENP